MKVAVMQDCSPMCIPCVKENMWQILQSTVAYHEAMQLKDMPTQEDKQWTILFFDEEGSLGEPFYPGECCCHCNKPLEVCNEEG